MKPLPSLSAELVFSPSLPQLTLSVPPVTVIDSDARTPLFAASMLTTPPSILKSSLQVRPLFR